MTTNTSKNHTLTRNKFTFENVSLIHLFQLIVSYEFINFEPKKFYLSAFFQPCMFNTLHEELKQ